MTKDEALAAKYFDEIRKPLDVLNDHLSKHEYVLGNRFTVADLNVACVLNWASAGRFSLAEWPKVEAWLGEVCGTAGREEGARDPIGALTTLRGRKRCEHDRQRKGQCSHSGERCTGTTTAARSPPMKSRTRRFAGVLRHLRDRRDGGARGPFDLLFCSCVCSSTSAAAVSGEVHADATTISQSPVERCGRREAERADAKYSRDGAQRTRTANGAQPPCRRSALRTPPRTHADLPSEQPAFR